jgi:hypothetical protein
MMASSIVHDMGERSRPCPTCGAPEDQPCVTGLGVPTLVHRERELQYLYEIQDQVRGGRNKTRLVGWHPSDPSLIAWLDAEVERRGGGRGVRSAVLDEALAAYRKQAETTQTGEQQ